MAGRQQDELEKRLPHAGCRPLYPGPDADVCAPSRDLPWQYGLYLALHCPRCGQLAPLDPDRDQRLCLAEAKHLHQFTLALDAEIEHH